VAAALAATTCDSDNNYDTFYLELKAASTPGSGTLIFHCPVENDFSEERGTWLVLKDNDGNYTVLSLIVLVELAGVPDPVPFTINVNDFVLAADNNTFTGQADKYPMKEDLDEDLGLTNSQFITTDLVFDKVE